MKLIAIAQDRRNKALCASTHALLQRLPVATRHDVDGPEGPTRD